MLPAILSLTLLLSAAQEAPPGPEALAQGQLEAYNAQDIEAFAAFYAEDVEVYNLPDGSKPSTRGIAAFRENYGRLFARPEETRIRCEVTNRLVQGAFVFDQEECFVGDSEEPAMGVVAIYETGDGKIKRVWFAR
jgi:hypothetical protein